MLKKITLLLALTMIFVVGCEPQPAPPADAVISPIAGSWQPADARIPWRLTFDNQGKLTEFTHPTGHTITNKSIEEGEYITDDKTYHYEFGPCEALYKTQTRELSVNIIINNCAIKMGGETFNFKMTDIFAGKLSDDGKTLAMTQVSSNAIVVNGQATASDANTQTINFLKVQ